MWFIWLLVWVYLIWLAHACYQKATGQGPWGPSKRHRDSADSQD